MGGHALRDHTSQLGVFVVDRLNCGVYNVLMHAFMDTINHAMAVKQSITPFHGTQLAEQKSMRRLSETYKMGLLA